MNSSYVFWPESQDGPLATQTHDRDPGIAARSMIANPGPRCVEYFGHVSQCKQLSHLARPAPGWSVLALVAEAGLAWSDAAGQEHWTSKRA
jgi:hypothetical protein